MFMGGEGRAGACTRPYPLAGLFQQHEKQRHKQGGHQGRGEHAADDADPDGVLAIGAGAAGQGLGRRGRLVAAGQKGPAGRR